LRAALPFGLRAGRSAADGGWLLPAAVAGALGVLISRRRQGRRDPLRAAVVLWGGWWLVLAVFFSVGTYLTRTTSRRSSLRWPRCAAPASPRAAPGPGRPGCPDPRGRWIESHCTRLPLPPPPHRRPVPYANFFCGPGPVSR